MPRSLPSQATLHPGLVDQPSPWISVRTLVRPWERPVGALGWLFFFSSRFSFLLCGIVVPVRLFPFCYVSSSFLLSRLLVSAIAVVLGFVFHYVVSNSLCLSVRMQYHHLPIPSQHTQIVWPKIFFFEKGLKFYGRFKMFF